MVHMSRMRRWPLRVRAPVAIALCAALVTDVAIAAPTLQSVAVTPAASSTSVGQKVFFKATGTFSDGSTHVLGPAITDIAPGISGTCVLLSGGGAKCWGSNWSGELGDGTTDDSVIARRVRGITDATAVAYGSAIGCALLARGAVKCWGWNYSGQLGNGTTTESSVPVAVTGITSATAVDVGVSYACALLADGTIQCWGDNYVGSLGDGTNVSSKIPVPVTGINTATAIATGQSHTCALLASGVVQCWGLNDDGQLGNGTRGQLDYDGPGPRNYYSNRPVTVVGIDSATAIAAGQYFSCALLTSGAVWCWGRREDGELGDGGSDYPDFSTIPVSVHLTGTAVAITAGLRHACAVLSNGSAQCWGANYNGQLGDGLKTEYQSNTPVQVIGINAPVRLEAGFSHTCALFADGAMRCWGRDDFGQLGDRRRTGDAARPWPVNVIGTPGVEWQSSDPTKATILGSGRATGRSIGNTTITASTPGLINDNAVLTVK